MSENLTRKEALHTAIAEAKNYFFPKNETENADELSIDNTPTENSTNLVTSGGVYDELSDLNTAIQAKLSKPATGLAAGNTLQISAYDPATGEITLIGVTDPQMQTIETITIEEDGIVSVKRENANWKLLFVECETPASPAAVSGTIKINGSNLYVTNIVGTSARYLHILSASLGGLIFTTHLIVGTNRGSTGNIVTNPAVFGRNTGNINSFVLSLDSNSSFPIGTIITIKAIPA